MAIVNSCKPTEKRPDEFQKRTVVPPIVIRAKQPSPDGKQRPVAWEDDISMNALDDRPFENLPSPTDLPRDTFQDGLYQTLTEMLETDSLDQWLKRDIFPVPSLQALVVLFAK